MIREKLLELGAILVDKNGIKEYQLNTKYGLLKVYGDFEIIGKRSKLWSCFTCFEDPTVAKCFTNCNPYSGKWNFHYSMEDVTLERFMDIVLSDIKRVL